MPAFNDYDFGTTIFTSESYLLQEAIKKSNNTNVIVKIFSNPNSAAENKEQFYSEYLLIKDLASQCESVVTVSDFLVDGDKAAFVMEDLGASRLLKNALKEKQFNVQEFLKLAISLSQAVMLLHQKNVIHKRLSSASIFYNEETGKIKIINFDLASRLTVEHPEINGAEKADDSLPYMAPEQTGQMNRTVDYRTDYYSLGMIFYEILTGQLLFAGKSMEEIIYEKPAAPNSIKNDVNKVISDLVMKLIEKDIEDRYQSMIGLQFDLKRCSDDLQAKGKIDDFIIGEHDTPTTLQVSQKLFGRKQELENLLTEAKNIAHGAAGLILISGDAGVGKTALVYEAYRDLSKIFGHFIFYKFDQLNFEIPYASLIRAMRQLVHKILNENQEKIKVWAKELLEVLQEQGKLIIDVVPELELIIGKQPDVILLDVIESKNRFHTVFKNFIRAFAKEEHPLILFLDDMQWADAPSLYLLQDLLTDETTKYFCLLGAYRNSDVDQKHPLSMMSEEIKTAAVKFKEILLSLLTASDAAQMISHTFRQPVEDVETIANFCFAKTRGNPFFLMLLLNKLYAGKALIFDFENRKWQWNIGQIEKQPLSENNFQLITEQLSLLPEHDRRTLALVACLGSRFDLKTVSLLEQLPLVETVKSLWPSFQAGFIVPVGDAYKRIPKEENKEFSVVCRFLHNSVQQAAYNLFGNNAKKALHLKIGNYLLNNYSQEDHRNVLFVIVTHLNQAASLIENNEERRAFIQLNFQAAQKAKSFGAFISALQYLRNGNIFIDSSMSWDSDYDFLFNYVKEHAELEYLVGNIDESRKRLDFLLTKAATITDKANVYKLILWETTNEGKFAETFELAEAIFATLGIDLPLDKSYEDLKPFMDAALEEIKKLVGDRSIKSLIDNPNIMTAKTDTKRDLLKFINLKLAILNLIKPAAYPVNPALWGLIIMEMVKLSLKYGNVENSCGGFAAFGALQTSLYAYDNAYDFAELAWNLTDKLHVYGQKAYVAVNWGAFVIHWKKPLSAAIKLFDEGYLAAVSSGDIQWAGYCRAFKDINLFHQGVNLAEHVLEIRKCLRVYAESAMSGTWYLRPYLMISNNLLEITANEASFDDEDVSELKFLTTLESLSIKAQQAIYYSAKAFVLYLYEDFENALDCVLKAHSFLPFATGVFEHATNSYVHSLTLAQLYARTAKKTYQLEIKNNQERMHLWMKNCPENFEHMYLLVEAERVRLEEKNEEAMTLYDKAIDAAKRNHFIQHVAIANELAAKFLLTQNNKSDADKYMREAFSAYERWGAKRKITLLHKGQKNNG